MMRLNIIDAVYCLKEDLIVSIAVCKRGQNYKSCPFYRKEKTRSDGVKELICAYGEEDVGKRR